MSAAKLLKKREHKMCTGLKNGKMDTIYIYGIAMLLLFNISLKVNASETGPKTDGKWVIVIDPGHGGRDPGALGSISREKNINLAIAQKTAAYIRDNIRDSKVILTRDKDITVDLLERPKIANRNNADLFISIHTNWAGSKSVTGAETWVMGLASSDENLQVAMKENEVILLEDDYSTKYQGFDPKSAESYIIFTLTQNIYQKQSIDLAVKIQKQFTDRVGRKDRGVKQAGFWVLYNTTMPSVLVETGFITSPAEEKYLNSSEGQDYMASAIYRACRDYLEEISERSSIKIDQAAETTAVKDVNSNITVVDEVLFMVQVAAASAGTEIKPENFKGLTDIEEVNTGDRFRYVSGKFKDYSDAVKHRKKLEAIYPDAFVIAVKDNKILPLSQALEQKRRK